MRALIFMLSLLGSYVLQANDRAVRCCEKTNIVCSGKDAGQEECAFYYDEKLKKKIYTHPQIMAKFPKDGDMGTLKFVTENLNAQKQDELQGKVSLFFIVDDDGTILCAKVLKRVNEDSDHYSEKYEYKKCFVF